MILEGSTLAQIAKSIGGLLVVGGFIYLIYKRKQAKKNK